MRNEMMSEDFGILTLATPNDYLKAIGLALSLKVSNPGVKTAVACSAKLFSILRPYFDHLVEERKGLRGFAHKVYLDQYSPFKTTLFFDSDILVFKNVHDYINTWPKQPYAACGQWMTGGLSSFGLDRAAVIKRLGVDKLVGIDGAGHALFHVPESNPLFDRAREITESYSEFAGNAKYADEDVMNMAMTEFGMAPAQSGQFFARYCSARPGTMEIDSRVGLCRFLDSQTGDVFEPCMIHFAADEAPLPYTYQLWLLFGKFGVSRKELLRLGVKDWFNREIYLRLHRVKQKLISKNA